MKIQQFPSWRFHFSGNTKLFPDRLVGSQAEADALGPEWTNGDAADAVTDLPDPPSGAETAARHRYPSWRFHPTKPARIVKTAELDAALQAEDPLWTNGDAPAVTPEPDPAPADGATAVLRFVALLDGTVDEVEARLPGLAVDVLHTLEDCEASGKNRKGVLAAIQEELATVGA